MLLLVEKYINEAFKHFKFVFVSDEGYFLMLGLVLKNALS